MAQLSLGESKWRMLRMALRAGRRFRIGKIRLMSRADYKNMDWLVSYKMVEVVGASPDPDARVYALTPAGRAAADLGFYEYTDWTAGPPRLAASMPGRGGSRPLGRPAARPPVRPQGGPIPKGKL